MGMPETQRKTKDLSQGKALMSECDPEMLLLNHIKTPGFLASRGEEFNLGPEMRLDCS